MTLFILGLILSMQARAADSWIHVVGIDEKNPEQNYSSFYQSAVEFNESCKKSKKNPNCTLYINDDPTLKRKEQNKNIPEQNLKIENNSGTPNAERVLTKIKESVINSKSGDTVIISLENHGAPLARSASCVWVKSDEQICDQDIAAILKHKPAGVKVVLSADACFSGAFADLTSLEVCSMTAASRYAVGYVSGRGIWNAINERFPKNLSDLKEPILAESGKQKLLGSQVILQSLCSDARKQLKPDEVISDLKRGDSYNAFQTEICRDADNSAKSLSSFSSQVVRMLSRHGNKTCAETKAPAFVCDSIERLKRAEPELKSVIASSLKLKDKQQELNDWVIKFHSEAAPALQKLGTFLKTKLSTKEQLEIAESFKLGTDPDWNKFDPKIRNDLRKAYGPIRSMRQKNQENEALVQTTDRLYDTLKKGGLYDDLMNVQNCFTENAPVIEDETSEIFRRIATHFTPRQFTLKDYEDAKKCEASISL